MPRHTQKAHLFELAKRGAEARFRELVQEAKYLMGLRDSFEKDERRLLSIVAKGGGHVRRASAAERPRRRMSVAARKAVSLRMKRYWAARRKAAAKGREPEKLVVPKGVRR